jgi:hypothetical protein
VGSVDGKIAFTFQDQEILPEAENLGWALK